MFWYKINKLIDLTKYCILHFLQKVTTYLHLVQFYFTQHFDKKNK